MGDIDCNRANSIGFPRMSGLKHQVSEDVGWGYQRILEGTSWISVREVQDVIK